jgi:1-acyl-sn-glycerol-3-phosphate acyltransferase
MTDNPHPPAGRPRDLVAVAVLLIGIAACYGLIRTTVPHPYPVRLEVWALAGPAGLFAGLLYWHRYRGMGFVPYALTGATVVGVWATIGGWCEVTVAAASFLLGFSFTRLVLYLDRFYRGTGTAGWHLLAAAGGFVLGGGMLRDLWFTRPLKGGPDPLPVVWFAGIAAGLAVFAWVRLLRPAVELFIEPLLWLMYKIRATGPGLRAVPARGPCLVIANHTCWPDPLFLAKVLPRPVTPMMTSRFYDLPVIRWFVRHVFRVIRVPEKPLKQSAPEIDEAIAALDRGECVVIFPEGYLRRSEERPLRRFGRGVWQVLKSRPGIPVFACWIEGGWGSYTSYANGPPTKNKKKDFRRPIGVGVSGPIVVDPATLEDHLRTRVFLMNQVIDARKHLGLPDLPRVELPEREEKDEDAD